MRTDKQNQASRKNGAKGKGPITPEGKAASANNSKWHNLCKGHLVLLSNENPREFHRLQDDYFIRFQPIDGVELDLVNKMIAATWRERRVTSLESALFELEMIRQQPDVDDEYSQLMPEARQALALFGSRDTQATAGLLQRYGSSARRAYTAAFKTLRELQGDRFNNSGATGFPEVALRPDLPWQNPHDTRPVSPPVFPEDSAGEAPHAIVVRKRTDAACVPKNTELPNEPERVMVAGRANPTTPVRLEVVPRTASPIGTSTASRTEAASPDSARWVIDNELVGKV